jgi:hypothetical protein
MVAISNIPCFLRKTAQKNTIRRPAYVNLLNVTETIVSGVRYQQGGKLLHRLLFKS